MCGFAPSVFLSHTAPHPAMCLPYPTAAPLQSFARKDHCTPQCLKQPVCCTGPRRPAPLWHAVAQRGLFIGHALQHSPSTTSALSAKSTAVAREISAARPRASAAAAHARAHALPRRLQARVSAPSPNSSRSCAGRRCRAGAGRARRAHQGSCPVTGSGRCCA